MFSSFPPWRFDSTPAPQLSSSDIRRRRRSTGPRVTQPGAEDNGGLGVDGPRRSHLPRRECSPFVRYCGMRRQIDEGRFLQGGAQSPEYRRRHRDLPLLLSPRSAVTWPSRRTLGEMMRESVFEKLTSCSGRTPGRPVFSADYWVIFSCFFLNKWKRVFFLCCVE